MLSIIGLIWFDPSRTNLEPRGVHSHNVDQQPHQQQGVSRTMWFTGMDFIDHSMGKKNVPKLSFGKPDRYVEAMLDIEWWHMMTLFGSLQLNEVWLKLSTLKACFGCVDPLQLRKVPQITKLNHDLQSLNQHFCRHTNLLLGIPGVFFEANFWTNDVSECGKHGAWPNVVKHDATVKKKQFLLWYRNRKFWLI